MSKSIVVLIALIIYLVNSSLVKNEFIGGDAPVVFCYWGAWSLSRPAEGRFGVQELVDAPCSHVVYSFIGLTATGDLTRDEEAEVEGNSNGISEFVSLKRENPSLTLLVAIGGWAEGSENFSTVSNDALLRASFVRNLVEFIQQYGLDGLDLDWEYPAQRGGIEADKESFILLLRELRAAFEPRGWLLTAAVAVTQHHIELSYDVPAMNELLDYINLMTYDYHGSWSDSTGANAPLYPQLSDHPDSELNVDASVNVWIANGASPAKLLLGLANYGRTFNLSDASIADPGAPFDGPGDPGAYTAEAGFLAYYEICTDLQDNAPLWSTTEVNSSYVYSSRQHMWIGYDNNNTIYAKASYARSVGLGGVMFWAVDLDDFSGRCGARYPLTHSAVLGWRAGSAAAALAPTTIALLAALIIAKNFGGSFKH